MKKLVYIILFAVGIVQGQNSVKGTISNASEYKYAILYQLKGMNQNYILNADIIAGKFSFEMPADASKGVYRLSYNLEHNLFVDFIYNNEAIEVEFDGKNPTETTNFLISEENKIHSNYFDEITMARLDADAKQLAFLKREDDTSNEALEDAYLDAYQTVTDIQASYEALSEGKLVQHFIKADAKYYAPELIQTPQEYLTSTKEHFFDYIDFNDAELNNSTVISQKVIDYVFYLNQSDDPQVQTALYKSAVLDVLQKIGTNNSLVSEISTVLMYTFIQVKNNTLIDFVLNDVYKKLPFEVVDQVVISEIETKLKLAIGRVAPNFSWVENRVSNNLHKLAGFENYVIVFWSSSCSHCLAEIPQVYEYFKDNKKVKVLSISLEKEDVEFKKYAVKYSKWTSILGLNKWENSIAKQYNVVSTPTYFILDADKKIIDKPEFLKDVKAFLEK
ncbi:MAG: TlpA family protein disulfide reductase [Lutibacter sp.]|nr:TlpA family protein disulfide reductase [Lutibacter sp.]MBP9601504.1 TlpA family protein disulfide reductase [Lutibacter sp.]